MIHDDRQCSLGEGPLWHPERGQLFWCDINAGRVLTRDADGPRHWQFDGPVSALGWVDRDTLLVASDRALLRFDLQGGARDEVCPLEADNSATRSNDGRADPHGGFWIGTMGRGAEDGAGAIYRYYRGELRQLYPGISIPNAMCFTPDGARAFFCDTREQVIRSVALDGDGWPAGASRVWLDLRGTPYKPDGAVIDAEGNLWNAQYGAGRVACYSPEGEFLKAIDLPATQATCPAFGGPDLATLYCTSAWQELPEAARAATPDHGRTFALAGAGRGLPEPRVIL